MTLFDEWFSVLNQLDGNGDSKHLCVAGILPIHICRYMLDIDNFRCYKWLAGTDNQFRGFKPC